MSSKPLSAIRIRDLIDVPPVRTVIRLDDAATDPVTLASTFVFTADVGDHFHVLGRALAEPTGKGYFLQGDFGSGKSHFLASLGALLSGSPGAQVLAQGHPALQTLVDSGRTYLCVPISLVNFRASTSLERIVTGAIEQALSARGVHAAVSTMSRLRARIATLLADPADAAAFWTAAGIPACDLDGYFRENEAGAFAATARFLKQQGLGTPEQLIEERSVVFGDALEVVKKSGFAGTVILIDELSEFFRSKPGASPLNEDARTLQFLGELASGEPLWIIAAVQESLERTGDIASTTFRKIKDRFPVKFTLSTVHVRDLIGKRLVRHKPEAAEDLRRVYNQLHQQFPASAMGFARFCEIYPVHPFTLSLLEGLGDLFSQHRGIVDFVHARIAGDAQRRITGILDRPAVELLAPDSIYDHFSTRLLEISAFNTYPRHVIPHLDDVIAKVIAGKEDQALARRLVRILVLYAIHPSAQAPGVLELAEMVGCVIDSAGSGAAVEFVAGALLDPLVQNSSFLSREGGPKDLKNARYRISAQEDSARILGMRIARVAAEIAPADSRLLLWPLSIADGSSAWPGRELLDSPVERTVLWRQSTRRVLVAFALADTMADMSHRLRSAVERGGADCCVLICRADNTADIPHTAVWRLQAQADPAPVREYVAARLVAESLNPGNPAEGPLIPLAQEAVARSAGPATVSVLDGVYAGRFDGGIVVEEAALRMRRFDRLMEMAAAHLLERRFPKFCAIAPRLQPATQRTWNMLHEGFVAPGTITLAEARTRGLTEALDSVATPLGLVEVKGGAYRLAPNPADNPFLAELFSHLSASGPTPMGEVVEKMRTGAYGAQPDTVHFVLGALAHSGLVTLMANGRVSPLEFVKPQMMHSIESVAPGELIGPADRQLLLAACPFLAPQGGFPSFGLRQQRDAWQATIKLKRTIEALVASTENCLRNAADFSAFDGFDFEGARERCGKLMRLADEIKTSYSAREGLERFLGAWQEQGLSADDPDRAKLFERFLSTQAEHLVHTIHYLRHRSVEAAAALQAETGAAYRAVTSLLQDPEQGVIADEGEGLTGAFERFRELYVRMYAIEHRDFQKGLEPPRVSRHAQRAIEVLRSLSAIRALDRPPGLDRLLSALGGPRRQPCGRGVAEELVRGPVCSCGFCIGDPPPATGLDNAEESIDRHVEAYGRILSTGAVLEPLMARAYAIRDVEPDGASRLSDISQALRKGASGGSLVDLLDGRTVALIGRALDETTVVEERTLAVLGEALAGRRLTPARAREAFEQWLGSSRSGAILAIEGSAVTQPDAPPMDDAAAWWSMLHPGFLDNGQSGAGFTDISRVNTALERLLPVQGLIERFHALSPEHLAAFIAREPVYLAAVGRAWEVLALRVVEHTAGGAQITPLSAFTDRKEGGVIVSRLCALRTILSLDDAAFPERLRMRVPLSEVFHDPWAGADLRSAVERRIGALEADALPWLESLPPLGDLTSAQSSCIIVVDGMPADVWLAASAALDTRMAPTRRGWFRLDGESSTVPSMQLILGIPPDRDPMVELAARGIRYYRFSGVEGHCATDMMEPLEPGQNVVVRLGSLDHAVHTGSARLPDLPGLLERMLIDHILPVVDLCRRTGVGVVLTTDHGLRFNKGALSHGTGTVFERAVVAMWWE